MQELFFSGNSPLLILSGSKEVFCFLLKEYYKLKGIQLFWEHFQLQLGVLTIHGRQIFSRGGEVSHFRGGWTDFKY
jgi:hypothetical protein